MGSVVGVVGGCGGVGASTLAASIAADSGAVLLDIDAAGGGIDVLLGIEDVAGARWSAVEVAGGPIDPQRLRDGLPRWGAIPVLAADRAAEPGAIDPVLDAARALAPVVLDLGRAPTTARAVAIQRCTLIVLVVAADLPGVAAARAALASFVPVPVALVVRRGHLPPDEAAELVEAPLAGVLPPVKYRAGAPLDAANLPSSLVHVAAGIADGIPP